MAIFSRILDFKRNLLARLRDQRKEVRHRTGAEFGLQATAVFGDLSWSGRVTDVSANGLSFRLPLASAARRGEATMARLVLDGRELVVPCTVAHHRATPMHALCGLRLEFRDFAVQKSWMQIVEAVSLGTSFKPADEARISLGLARRQWRSARHTRLTEWRETGTRKIERFEFVLAEHALGARRDEPGLTISPASDRSRSATGPVCAEVRQLFLWVLANLPASAAIPADLREFMRSAATGSPGAAGTASRAPAAAPAGWAAPARPATSRNPG
ncbi:MAG TPA: PilZ domain-containing protein [Lacunisphaera sp.]|nr:PilZ domain-containing protein [Lacunisphaera sp.]